MSNPVPADVVRVGDTVTVQFRGDDGSTQPADLITISGRLRLGLNERDLVLGTYIVAHSNGNAGPDVVCITHRLAVEPPLGTLVKDGDGDYWVHLPEGWCLLPTSARERLYTWAKVNEFSIEPVTA